MFKVIDALGLIHDAYGAFPDDDGDVQFVLCDNNGDFYITNTIKGYYKLYKEQD